MLKVRKRDECRWDLVALGEVMLRFDPGEDRIRTARNFRVWEGGGEYNVARTLAHCFGARASILTALADNHIGRLVADLISQAAVDTSNIIWREVDGISGNLRNGLNFVERGFGTRQPVGCSDRANTAISNLRTAEIDLSSIFDEQGSRWFHTGGIFAALSKDAPEVAIEAMRAARANGSIVSYDLNYRSSLWEGRGGLDAANAVNRRLLNEADVVFGIEGFDSSLGGFTVAEFETAARSMIERHPSLKMVATTLRDVISASLHNISGALYFNGRTFLGNRFDNVQVLDRIGSGDAFAAGIAFGVLEDRDPQRSVDIAAANAAYAVTCPGDASTATLSDLETMVNRNGAKIER
ncbi:MAG TPA: sugar kinase [Pyrinomonadaceae bacterium]|nr:sugar kinase [Pyrinomonadaceae bacterium]